MAQWLVREYPDGHHFRGLCLPVCFPGRRVLLIGVPRVLQLEVVCVRAL